MTLIDFDKTLTYKDTLLGFYLAVCRFNKTKIFFLPIYFVFMVLYKIKLIDNESLKKIGVFLFLKNQLEKNIKKISLYYSKKIKLNNLYDKLNLNNDVKIVVTASFENYVTYTLGDNFCVHGTSLHFENNQVKGLGVNMFGDYKGDFVEKTYKNIFFESCYTDSLSDISILKLAKKKYLVKNDELIQLKNESFKKN
jgi:hypothetical protein